MGSTNVCGQPEQAQAHNEIQEAYRPIQMKRKRKGPRSNQDEMSDSGSKYNDLRGSSMLHKNMSSERLENQFRTGIHSNPLSRANSDNNLQSLQFMKADPSANTSSLFNFSLCGNGLDADQSFQQYYYVYPQAIQNQQRVAQALAQPVIKSTFKNDQTKVVFEAKLDH